MKIAGCVFQKRVIAEYNRLSFIASYKGYSIHVTSRHGFGYSNDYNLTRFNIDVYNDGGSLVETWEDFSTIEEAIAFALKESGLTTKKD